MCREIAVAPLPVSRVTGRVSHACTACGFQMMKFSARFDTEAQQDAWNSLIEAP
jgi:hypothetical protein